MQLCIVKTALVYSMLMKGYCIMKSTNKVMVQACEVCDKFSAIETQVNMFQYKTNQCP